MFTIQGNINATFDAMEALIPDIEKTTLNVGGNFLKEQVKSAFASKFPSATKPVRNQTVSRGYKLTTGEPLIDAVRQSKFAYNTVKVHIMGANRSGSPLFIARFYEDGTFRTNPRYQKTYRGKKLKKKKNLGTLRGYNFFKPTVEQYLDRTTQLMGEVYEHKIDKVFNQ